MWQVRISLCSGDSRNASAINVVKSMTVQGMVAINVVKSMTVQGMVLAINVVKSMTVQGMVLFYYLLQNQAQEINCVSGMGVKCTFVLTNVKTLICLP